MLKPMGRPRSLNKGIIKLIKRRVEENPRRWHTLLSEDLWSYRMACHGSTKVSPYQLVYGKLRPDLGDYLFKINWLLMIMLL